MQSIAGIGDANELLCHDMNRDFRQVRRKSVQLEKIRYGSDDLGLESFQSVSLNSQSIDVAAAGDPNGSLFIPLRPHNDRYVLHTMTSPNRTHSLSNTFTHQQYGSLRCHSAHI